MQETGGRPPGISETPSRCLWWLVAPLLEENAVSREVYLPEGMWFDFFDGTGYVGGQTITAGKDGKLPVFIRNGFTL